MTGMPRMVRRQLSPGTNMEIGARAEGEWLLGPACPLWLHLTITLSWEKNPGNHSASPLLCPCSVRLAKNSFRFLHKIVWKNANECFGQPNTSLLGQGLLLPSPPPSPLSAVPPTPPPGWVTPLSLFQGQIQRLVHKMQPRDSGLFCPRGTRGRSRASVPDLPSLLGPLSVLQMSSALSWAC